jgi:hypothetical protein
LSALRSFLVKPAPEIGDRLITQALGFHYFGDSGFDLGGPVVPFTGPRRAIFGSPDWSTWNGRKDPVKLAFLDQPGSGQAVSNGGNPPGSDCPKQRGLASPACACGLR